MVCWRREWDLNEHFAWAFCIAFGDRHPRNHLFEVAGEQRLIGNAPTSPQAYPGRERNGHDRGTGHSWSNRASFRPGQQRPSRPVPMDDRNKMTSSATAPIVVAIPAVLVRALRGRPPPTSSRSRTRSRRRQAIDCPPCDRCRDRHRRREPPGNRASRAQRSRAAGAYP